MSIRIKKIVEKVPLLGKIVIGLRNKLNDLNYEFCLVKRKTNFKNVFYKSYEIFTIPMRDELLNLILKNSCDGETLFDIGAYLGNYTLTFLSKYRNCKVVAFEPNPISYKKLIKNIECNQFSNRVITYNIGLSNYEDNLPFYSSNQKGRSSFNKYNAEFENAHIQDCLIIKVKPLDSIICKLPIPNHIKIDVEGYELEVLQGMKKTIMKYNPNVYMAVHEISNNVKDTNQRQYNIKKFFYE